MKHYCLVTKVGSLKYSIFAFFLAALFLATNDTAQAQASRKAVVNATTNDMPGLEDSGDYVPWHQAANWGLFLERAPIDWTNYIAGFHGPNTSYISELGWVPHNGGEMIRRSVTNGFQIVMHYGSGRVDPEAVYFAARNGCAVFSYASNDEGLLSGTPGNTHHYFDYRKSYSDYSAKIYGRGPTPAMIVSGGYSSSANAIYAYGAQGEFIDAILDGAEPAQSYAHSATAARYARIVNATGWTNTFDLRQALRQTCTFYTNGWREDGGYGFPLVSNRVGNTFVEAAIPTSLTNLDVAPPIQPSVEINVDGNTTNMLFRWYNFRQTGFESTVVKIDGTTVYEGDGTSFVLPLPVNNNSVAEFFTKLSTGRMSRNYGNSSLEPYARIELNNLNTNYVDCAILSSGVLTTSNFTFSVLGHRATWYWIYASSNLVDWQVIDCRFYGTENLLGYAKTNRYVSGIFTHDFSSNAPSHMFYRVAYDGCCSQPIGFYKINVGAGSSALIGNQLIEPDNSIGTLFNYTLVGSHVPNGAKISKWNGSQFIDYTWSSSSSAWSPSIAGLNFALGEGLAFYNPSSNALTLAFVGLVPEGQLTNAISTTGSQVYSSMLPLTGGINAVLGFPSSDWDSFNRWDSSINTYWQALVYITGEGWYDANFDLVPEPILQVGEAFALVTTTNRNWIQTFERCSGQIVYTHTRPFITDASFEVIGDLLSFNFIAHSDLGVEVTLSKSDDLENWETVTTGIPVSTAMYSGDTEDVANVDYRFYRLNNGWYCSQPVGFYKIKIEAGSSALIGNQLIEANNSLAALFNYTLYGTHVPDGTKISKWNGSQFIDYTWSSSSSAWSPSIAGLNFALGEGLAVYNPSSNAITLAFIGHVAEGPQTKAVSTTGSQIYSSMLPLTGGINTVLGFPLSDWDSFNRWDGNINTYGQALIYITGEGWYDANFDLVSEPTLKVGEAFALVTTTNRNWTKNLTIPCP